tara:strand:+ start:43 stop:261 length:219 start_codon:yes stop_codon:yes gene_type:complete
MTVYQVQEYYICTTGEKLNGEQREAIKELLKSKGYSNYKFEASGQITVDDIPSEEEGEILEDQIYEAIVEYK